MAVGSYPAGQFPVYPLTDAAPHSSRRTDKPEGVAITDSGQTYVFTDNDGVEDRSGEI